MVNHKQHLALMVATEAHGTQTRKYTGDFYIVHPLEVRQILVECGVTDSEMLEAALMHDVLEDTDFTEGTLRLMFSKRTVDLVVELTTVEVDGNRAVRKAAEAERLSKVSSAAQMVKCADFISNTRDIAARDAGFAKKYLAEKRTCLMLFSDETKRSQVFRTALAQVNMLQGVYDVDA